MGTVAEKLDKLLETKAAIRQAIIAQGVDVPESLPFSEYAAKIAAIERGITLPASIAGAGILSGRLSSGSSVTSNLIGIRINSWNKETGIASIALDTYRGTINSGGTIGTFSITANIGNAEPAPNIGNARPTPST